MGNQNKLRFSGRIQTFFVEDLDQFLKVSAACENLWSRFVGGGYQRFA
jgi:hypothetical protein